MLIEGLVEAHETLVQRTLAAMGDAKSAHQKQSDASEDWSLFASGLTFLEHFGPWLIEVIFLETLTFVRMIRSLPY